MPSAQRRPGAGLIQRLFEEPHRFQFFQAVRLLELYFKHRGHRPDEVLPQRLRFQNSMSLSFPASEIEQAAAFGADGAPLDIAAQPIVDGALGEARLTPAFIGLLGNSGALPIQYTERLAERELYQRDRAARAFFDAFSNRSVALFYSAWKKYRLHTQYELDNQERFLPLLLALAGLGFNGLRQQMDRNHGEVFDEAVGHYAAAIRQRPASASMVQRVLRSYFNVPLRLEQFVGHWYQVPLEQRTRLGGVNAVLNTTALVGERVWQRDLRVRLWIGPLQRRQFEDFLPGGARAAALAKMVTLLTGLSLEYEVKLILRAEDVSGVHLRQDRDDGRLGWDAFLCSRPERQQRTDASYQIHPT